MTPASAENPRQPLLQKILGAIENVGNALPHPATLFAILAGSVIFLSWLLSEMGDLTADEVAAITIAVLTHVRVRRGQAAPAMRDVQPGSQLFPSRWVAAGRAHHKRPWR